VVSKFLYSSDFFIPDPCLDDQMHFIFVYTWLR
jgi:hypothetical protein